MNVRKSLMAEPQAERTPLAFGSFWRQRKAGSDLWIDREVINSVSIYFAYAASRLRMTPNQLSVANAFVSFLALAAALIMPAANPILPIVAIFILAQISYILDCADGQLARATQRESVSGEFFDRAMDLAAIKLQFGAYFVFVYRHHLAAGSVSEARLWLFAGLVFVFWCVARFVVWQFFQSMLPEKYEATKSDTGSVTNILKNLISHQVSIVNMLTFLISPVVCLSIFLLQAATLALVWLRYFLRAAN